MRMKLRSLGLLAAAMLAPGLARAADVPPSQGPATDVFSYSLLEVGRTHAHSDYFRDDSSGTGIKFSYDFDGGVYLFGQWNKLDFDTLRGSHTLEAIGVGAHQAYNDHASFYVDAAFLKDELSSSLSGRADDYWRVTYGFRLHSSDLVEFDAAIFTERNTTFGGRPFGERIGLGLDFSSLALLAAMEHTADGNRTMLSLSWAYR
jgi:hypothetical protein